MAAGEPGGHDAAYLAATVELARELSSPLLAQRVATIGQRLGRAHHATLVLLGADDYPSDLATSGIEFERRTFDRHALDKSVLRVALTEARPVREDRVEGDPLLFAVPRDQLAAAVLAVPVGAGLRPMGLLYLTRDPHAHPFDETDEHLLKAFGIQAGVALEAASLRRSENSRQPLAQAVHEVSQALLGGRPTDEVLRDIVTWAAKLLDASVATVVTPDGGEMAQVRVAAGPGAHAVQDLRFALAGSITADVMRTRRPYVVGAYPDDRDPTRQPLTAEGFGPAAFVPLVVSERVFGTLAVAHDAAGRTFTGDDLAVIQAFAGEAAMALEYGDVRSELGRLALLEERERIAMELHDGVVQALFVVGLSLQAAEETSDDTAEMRQAVTEAVESIDRAIRDLRDYIFGLQPAGLADRHLERALRELVEGVRRAGRAGSLDLDPRAATALAATSAEVIQATREAVSNALRHSSAGHIAVAFRRRGNEVTLEVTDDGCGFDPGAVVGKGHGLANLRSRAEAMGGTLAIESDPRLGTRVRIRVAV